MSPHSPISLEMLTPKALSSLIDHTKLTFSPAEQTAGEQREAIARLCEEASRYRFKAVCVRPEYVALAKRQLEKTGVLVATVIGFPGQKRLLSEERVTPTIGAAPLQLKLQEVRQALAEGCDEFDLVMNVHQFLNVPEQATLDEFRAIRETCLGKCLKIIIETDLLAPEAVAKASTLCAQARADIVKTSTGMLDGGKGGTADVVALIHLALQNAARTSQESYAFGIKASGGIKTLQQVSGVVKAGATRIGTSNAIKIHDELVSLSEGRKPLS